MRVSFLLLVTVLCMLIGTCPSWGEYYGIVSDQVGEVGYISQGKKSEKDLRGYNLYGGDEVILEEGSILTVLSYVDDEELLIKGPVHVKFEIDCIVLVKGPDDRVVRSVNLYASYTPDEIASPVAGGIVLRGEKEDLRKLSNTELISSVMNDVRDRMLALKTAREHYEELKKRMPDSQFIESVEKYFEK